LLRDITKGVGRDNMNLDILGKGVQGLPDAVDEFAIKADRAVEIQEQVRDLQFVIPWNFDFKHMHSLLVEIPADVLKGDWNPAVRPQ
jgi:hypothetical protein